VSGGDGGDGGVGGRGGGHVRICAFHLDNRGVIDADGGNGGNGQRGSQGDYNDYYCQFVERDAAGGGGGGGGGGDAGDGGTVVIRFVVMIDEGEIHSNGGHGGAGGAAGGSRCDELVHPYGGLQVYHYGSPGCAPGEGGSGHGGYGGESDVGVMCGPTSHGEAGSAGADGALGVVDVGCTPVPEVPQAFALRQNAPNPFNPVTTIEYEVPFAGGRVLLEVFNAAGRRVRTLVDCVQNPSVQSVTWRGLDDDGQRVPSGVYFYRLSAPGYENTKRMLLLK